MNNEDLAKEIADAIFENYQQGMGTTNHLVAIAPEEKPQLIYLIKRTLDAKNL